MPLLCFLPVTIAKPCSSETWGELRVGLVGLNERFSGLLREQGE